MDFYADAFQTRMSREELNSSCVGFVSSHPDKVEFHIPRCGLMIMVDIEDSTIVVTQDGAGIKMHFRDDVLYQVDIVTPLH